MTKSRDLGNLAQTVAVNLPTALGTAGQTLVVNSGADGLEFGAASGGSGVTVYTGLSGTDGTPSGATYLLNASSPSAGDLAYVTANTSLYQNNGNGWYRIAVINTTPTISSVADASSNTTPFTLTAGTNTVITVTASDVDEGTDLTYSHSVTSGSLNGTTVTQGTGANENVFTIAPHASNSTTFSLTFTVSDSINAATSVAAFELRFIVTDSHYTSLLMATDGSAGDNATITYDNGSTTGNNLTEYGEVHAGTFSPYRHGGYSTYFDGSGDYIRYTDASLAEGTDDFTVEFWVSRTGNQGLNDTVVGHDTTPGYQICFNTSNNIQFMYNTGDASRSLSTGTLNEGQWYHVVYQRDNGTLQGFLDGVSLGTTSVTDNFTNTTIEIGVNRGGTAYFKGHVRDVRIIKGTAFYSSSGFDVPTEPLAAVSGTGYSTTLLSCHLPYIEDGGANSLTPTINGNTSTKPFGPYDYQGYSESTNGGSVYFDGSDYLQLSATATDLLPETSNTTIEAWVNTTGTGHVSVFSNFNPSSPFNGMEVGLYNGYQTIYSQGSWINNTGGTGVSTINDGSWHHLAWVITNSGATVTTYVDGVQNYTSSITASTTGSSNQRIGASSNSTVNRHFTGYISNVRFVKGTAVYSGAFTPPSGPLTTTGGTYPSTTNVDTNITASNTKLLLKGTDAHVIDKSQTGNVKLLDNTASTSVLTSNSTPPYIGAAWAGTSAVSFDGTGDRALITGVPDLGDDFTIEAWIYSTSTANDGIVGSIDNYQPFAGDGYWNFFRNASNKLILYIDGGTYTQSTSTVPLNQWVHVACTRSSGTVYYYIDGTRDSTTVSNSLFLKNPSGIVVGSSPNNNYIYNFNGYIQDLRLTVGKVRYTAADESSNIPSAPLKG